MRAPAGSLNDPMVPVPFPVRRSHKETGDVWTLEVEPPPEGFGFLPGQFNMLYVPGVGEVPISISGDPQEPGRLVHTTRAVGKVTQAICRLKKGQAVGIRGPFGRAWPVKEAEGHDVLFLAGGVGLAPLRPAIYHLLNHRERYGDIRILYGVRTPQDILYRRELALWRERSDVYVDITVDSADRQWKGNVGVVTKLIRRLKVDPLQTVAMICGPEIMMRFTVQELYAAGLEDEDIYVTMERNMKCAVGFCGHCQFGPSFICKDGPVFRFDRIAHLFRLREI